MIVPHLFPNRSPFHLSMTSSATQGFGFSRDQFQQIVEDVLSMAKALGASDAGVEVSEGSGLSVSVRKGEVENVERNRDKSVGVSVYLGQRRGNASTSDFSPQALEQTVRAAYDIARFTAEDPAAGLPDEADLATTEEAARSLDLFHPWDVTAEEAAELARRAEAASLAVDKRITNSEGGSVSAQQSHFWAGNSRGFRGGYASSRHSLSVSPIAGKGRDMQRDYWYSSVRNALDLASPEAVGRYAAERALSRLKSRKIGTCEVPVLFESTVAAGLLGAYVQGTSGGALYRKASFLQDSLGQAVWAGHIDITEDPHERGGKGSDRSDLLGSLTERERQILEHLARGAALGAAIDASAFLDADGFDIERFTFVCQLWATALELERGERPARLSLAGVGDCLLSQGYAQTTIEGRDAAAALWALAVGAALSASAEAAAVMGQDPIFAQDRQGVLKTIAERRVRAAALRSALATEAAAALATAHALARKHGLRSAALVGPFADAEATLRLGGAPVGAWPYILTSCRATTSGSSVRKKAAPTGSTLCAANSPAGISPPMTPTSSSMRRKLATSWRST